MSSSMRCRRGLHPSAPKHRARYTECHATTGHATTLHAPPGRLSCTVPGLLQLNMDKLQPTGHATTGRALL